MYALTSTVKSGDICIPQSYKQAMENATFQHSAIEAEFHGLEEQGYQELVDLPASIHCMNGMWVFDLKINSEGNIIKPKAYYVGQGNLQIPSIDFDKGWIIVVHMESMQITIVVVFMMKLKV